ncbi:hypothetical protein DYB28_004884 [Aphanomyces astaci]|uniref:Uncharacterized protein n=1 Tax=Aphanomyces astaci TaxID=112090 RepID=A0A397ANG2_APHAT|nr:hypothetical protein DYB25_010474 [Aphanomyces astaci]RHZ14555.1 hypothetical protein DYB31_003917 [Aphanomyces astaci]RLO05658.1 hypothetical protein DYB28_004884 [Aphanomyces astaci]
MKPVSVIREVYTTMLLDNVIPAIKAKSPQGETKGVIIQQDNAKPYGPSHRCCVHRATDIDKKIDELALEVAQAMDMSEFSSQMEKLSVDDELEDDIDLDLALLLGIDQLL